MRQEESYGGGGGGGGVNSLVKEGIKTNNETAATERREKEKRIEVGMAA